MPSSHPKIAVFWDLESCSPPVPQMSSCELLKNVREFTSSLGIVTSFRAYCSPNRGAEMSHAAAFRADLPGMGVTIVDCSLMKGSSEEALTRMLAVDVLVFAVDHPVNPDTLGKNIIMIFTGNDSVLYPLSLLVFRNYTIYLIVPDESDDTGASASFRNMATRVFSWQRDVLQLASGPEPAPSSTGERPRPQIPVREQARRSLGAADVMTTILPLPLPSNGTNTASSFPRSPRPFTSVPTPALLTPKTSVRSMPTPETPAPRAASTLSLNPEVTPSYPVNSIRNEGSDSGRSDDIRDQMLSQLTRSVTPDNVWDGGWGGLDTRSEPPKTREIKSVPLPSRQEINDVLAFEPLLRVLRDSLAEGKITVLRSLVGAELAKDKDVYKAAGVTNFGQYIALAVSKNLVTVGGVGGKDWVSLNLKFMHGSH